MREQSELVEWLSKGFEKIGAWSYDHRLFVFTLCVALLAACGWFAMGTRFDNSFEAYFDNDDPAYQAFLQFREDFGSDESAYILYEAPDYPYGPFNLEVMGKIRRLTEALAEEVPFVDEVTSLANAEFIEGVDDELLIHEVLEEFPDSQEKLLEIRDKVLEKEIYRGGLVSADGKYAALVVDMARASVDPLEKIQLDPDGGTGLSNLYPQVTFHAIEKILARPEYKGIRFYHTGDVALNSNYNMTAQGESLRLGIVAAVIIALLLLYFFKSAMGVGGPMVVVVMSVLVSLGFVGLMGWNLDLMVIMMPTVLIAVGVADAVHILSEFRVLHAAHSDRRKALKDSMYLVGVPCLFTSVTTIAGFSSMSVSPIKAIRHFAIYSSVGVAAAFLLTVTLLIVLLSFGRRYSEAKGDEDLLHARGGAHMQAGLKWVARFVTRRPKSIIAVSLALFAAVGAGMVRLEVDTNFLNEFSPRTKIRRVTEKVDTVMGGAGSFSYIFDSGEPEGMYDPEALAVIEAAQKKADEQDYLVMKTYSIVDLLKDLNRAMHNGDQEYYRLPESRQLVAQYLLLYEMSGGEELSEYLSTDYARANLEIRCRMSRTSKYEEAADTLNQHLAEADTKGLNWALTGMGALWIELIDYIMQSQIRGFLLAFAVIAVMMCLVFNSIRVGLVSMIPNLAPIIITLGTMGWMAIPLDYVKLLIACVAIGIAVDDTVHLVSRFRHEFYRTGNYAQAMNLTMAEVGRALFITTVVLVTGFSILVISIMGTLQSFGMLVAATILVALLADFFLLPAVFLLLKPFGPEGRPEPAEAEAEAAAFN
ncbi:MAG: MMPL family transporter [Deltaproteobacteria bacterium]|nr:MMPL family transporter [Deltaproteobacteria bacterium]